MHAYSEKRSGLLASDKLTPIKLLYYFEVLCSGLSEPKIVEFRTIGGYRLDGVQHIQPDYSTKFGPQSSYSTVSHQIGVFYQKWENILLLQ